MMARDHDRVTLDSYLDAGRRFDEQLIKGRDPASPFWPTVVSLGLWAFAAWQLALLPVWKPVLIRNQCELPAMARLLCLDVPLWLVLAVGTLCTVLTAVAPWRLIRGALVTFALLAAMFVHTANFFVQLKLNHICSMTQEERIRLGYEEAPR